MDITPGKQNLDGVFASTRYYIDFYQRDYRWTDEPVLRLLDDVFFKFNEAYETNSKLEPNEEVITEHYPWYYLNTYVTNKVGGKMYIVDGQQRLTTLTLIAIKLLHMAREYNSKLQHWLDRKIAGYSGAESEFWMNHEGHKAALKALYENELDDVDVSSGITAINLEHNFHTISRWLDRHLDSENKFATFVFYFLRRLVLIDLNVEQTDVPMVFEVINDRGVRLQPFEILKGKLLGQIDKTLLEQKDYSGLWEAQLSLIDYEFIDIFFRTWLKARFADTRGEGQKFDGDYHREIFKSDYQEILPLRHNPAGVANYLDGPFTYYTRLYSRIRKAHDGDNGALFYNRLNDLDSAFMLIMSACKIDDPEEDLKFDILPSEADRLFTLLQLQGAYDSNNYQELLYRISADIRDGEAAEIRDIFDAHLMARIGSKRGSVTTEPFRYAYFRNIGITNLNKRFTRYFFGRIDQFFAENTNMGEKHPLESLVTKTSASEGFHIEHILSDNDENRALFDDDENLFEQERNRLGGILLLKGKDNISSNNETYSNKLQSYANSLYWNETLREDSYKSKLDMRAMKEAFGLDLEAMSQFGRDELERRQKLLFQLVSIIWK